MKELILNSFYFGKVWWSWKNWFWTVSTLEQWGGLERTDFEQFLLWNSVMVSAVVAVMKELILNGFYFGKVWCSWKNSFWTVSTLEGCGGLQRSDFEQFLLWEGMMVFKELIVNSFYFERMWWSWKDWFWTVSTLGGCGGLQRTDFEQFLLWEGMMLLKELILNSFYFGTVWWSSKNWFWTVSTLGQCGGRCGGVVVMKELILNSFYFGRMWWSWKNWFWTVSTLGQCGGLQRTDFEQFLLWDSVVVGVVVW